MRLVAAGVVDIHVAVDAHLEHTACQLVSRSAPGLYNGAHVFAGPSSKATGRAVFKVDRTGNTSYQNRGGIWGSILVGISPRLVDQVKTCRALCSGRLVYILIGDVHCFFIYGVSGASSSPQKRMLANDVLEAFNAIHDLLPRDALVMVMGDMNAVVSPQDRSSGKLNSYDEAAYAIPLALQRKNFTDLHRFLHLDKNNDGEVGAQAAPTSEGHYTFHSFSPQGAKSRIDQLWLSPAALQRCGQHSQSAIAKEPGGYTTDHRLCIFALDGLFDQNPSTGTGKKGFVVPGYKKGALIVGAAARPSRWQPSVATAADYRTVLTADDNAECLRVTGAVAESAEALSGTYYPSIRHALDKLNDQYNDLEAIPDTLGRSWTDDERREREGIVIKMGQLLRDGSALATQVAKKTPDFSAHNDDPCQAWREVIVKWHTQIFNKPKRADRLASLNMSR